MLKSRGRVVVPLVLSSQTFSTSARKVVALDTIVKLCKKRGFIFPSAELYNSMSGFFDYGPLGVEMKNNIKQLWWREMVQQREDIVGLDSSIIGPAQLFEASGHTDEFSDYMVDCRVTKLRYRADQVYWARVESVSESEGNYIGHVCFLEEEGKSLQETGLKRAKRLAKKTGVAMESIAIPLQIRDLSQVNCTEELPHIPGPDSDVVGSLTPPRSFNLMFSTSIGPVQSDQELETNKAYLRPETAQGIFTNFLNVQRTSRLKIPFGVAQIGKAFRNEITPRNFLFRSREFEMMEVEYFIPPENYYSDKYFKEMFDVSWKFLLQMGLDESLLHVKVHDEDQLAHYAKSSTDIEFNYPFGIQELLGIADRGSYDLDCHARASGKSFDYLDKENFEHLSSDDPCEDNGQRKYTPHCIEPSVGVDRLFLAVLTSAYSEEQLDNGEKRVVLKLKPKVAPVKVAIFPLVKNNTAIMNFARDIYARMRKRYVCQLDTSGAVGRRYRRADEIGVPLCVTVDFDSLHDDCVTVRGRDSMIQTRVAMSDLDRFIYQEIEFPDS